MAAKSDLHPQVYHWFPERTFDRVLIIGAGTGTDVALALAQGAKHVDAVEIDPVLAQVGRDFHPEGVYKDPRVTVHVNDGRAFLNGSTRPVRPDHVRASRTRSRSSAPRPASGSSRSSSPRSRWRRRATTSRPTACSSMYNLYREPWLVAKLDTDARATSYGYEPLVRLIGTLVGDPRRRTGRRRPRRRPAARRLGRSGAERRRCRTRSPRPTTGRSCTCAPRPSRRTT